MRSLRLVHASYLRNFVFGVEDSLVSTVGLVSGIAAAGISKENIVTTGVVLIFVEAFSMAIGSFLSEESAEEYMAHKDSSPRSPVINGAIMFFSYFISGLVPLSPYIFLSVASAFGFSILSSLIALGVLGFLSSEFTGLKIGRGIFRMCLFGGMAIIVGIVVGRLTN